MKAKQILTGIAVSIFLLIGFTGCDTASNKSLLTDGAWTFSNLTTDSEDQLVTTLIIFAKALLTDATLEFQDDGNYLITSPLSEEPTTGTWELIVNDQLIMNPEGEVASTANIETLTKDKLKYIETMTDGETTYSVTTTWVR